MPDKAKLIEKYKTLMETEVLEGDIEAAHPNADGLLCKLLTELGYEEVVKVYDNVDKWYV